MKVYYAHSLALYGTPQEKRDVELLVSLGFEVFNPNIPEVQEMCNNISKEKGDDYFNTIFIPLVSKCDALAFRSFNDLKIGAGAYNEILIAKERGIPVFELPSALGERGLSVETTRERLKELGQR